MIARIIADQVGNRVVVSAYDEDGHFLGSFTFHGKKITRWSVINAALHELGGEITNPIHVELPSAEGGDPVGSF